jgi:hypothetical protein
MTPNLHSKFYSSTELPQVKASISAIAAQTIIGFTKTAGIRSPASCSMIDLRAMLTQRVSTHLRIEIAAKVANASPSFVNQAKAR